MYSTRHEVKIPKGTTTGVPGRGFGSILPFSTSLLPCSLALARTSQNVTFAEAAVTPSFWSLPRIKKHNACNYAHCCAEQQKRRNSFIKFFTKTEEATSATRKAIPSSVRAPLNSPLPSWTHWKRNSKGAAPFRIFKTVPHRKERNSKCVRPSLLSLNQFPSRRFWVWIVTLFPRIHKVLSQLWVWAKARADCRTARQTPQPFGFSPV